MQKLRITLLLICATTVYSFGQLAIPENITHELNIEQSALYWKGSYTFNITEYNGIVRFKKGTLTTFNRDVIGGSFIIDMHSIDNLENSEKRGPIEHLKDPDFFDVQKFPEATLVITSIEYFPNTNTHEVFADLTIKGITRNITFYAEIDGAKNTLTTHFKIDRTLWGITYNNKIKNKAISEAIEFRTVLQF